MIKYIIYNGDGKEYESREKVVEAAMDIVYRENKNVLVCGFKLDEDNKPVLVERIHRRASVHNQ